MSLLNNIYRVEYNLSWLHKRRAQANAIAWSSCIRSSCRSYEEKKIGEKEKKKKKRQSMRNKIVRFCRGTTDEGKSQLRKWATVGNSTATKKKMKKNDEERIIPTQTCTLHIAPCRLVQFKCKFQFSVHTYNFVQLNRLHSIGGER